MKMSFSDNQKMEMMHVLNAKEFLLKPVLSLFCAMCMSEEYSMAKNKI